MRKSILSLLIMCVIFLSAIVPIAFTGFAQSNYQSSTSTSSGVPGNTAPFTTITTLSSPGNTTYVYNENWPYNPAAKYGGDLVVDQNFNPASLIADYQNQAGSNGVSGNILCRLVSMDNGLTSGEQPYGDLAQSVSVLNNGQTYVFKLYHNANWTDGTPLTSADVVYTYDQIIANKYPGYYQDLSAVQNISAPDPYTVVMNLFAPSAAFLINLGSDMWYDGILPVHIYNGTTWSSNPNNMNPVGCGPYVLSQAGGPNGTWVTNDHITLVANKHWFHGTPYLNSVTIRFVSSATTGYNDFLAKTSDMLQGLYYLPSYSYISQLNSTAGVSVYHVAAPYDRAIIFNLKQAPWNNSLVREAIAYAINRSQVTQLGFFGTYPGLYYAQGLENPNYINYSAKFPDTNLTRAEQLLDQAGYPMQSSGYRFVADLSNRQSSDDAATAQVVAQQLAAIGIKVNRVVSTYATWLQSVETGNYSISITYDYYGIDPSASSALFTCGAANNYMGYCNPQVDQLYKEGLSTLNTTQRATYYDKIQSILVQQMPYIPIVQAQYFWAVWNTYNCFDFQSCGMGHAYTWFGYAGVYYTGGTSISTATAASSSTPSATSSVSTITSPSTVSSVSTTSASKIAISTNYILVIVAAIVVIAVLVGVAYFAIRRRPAP